MSEVKEAKEIKRPRINDEKFVKAWMTAAAEGGTQKDVAEELGCTQGGVASKFKKMAKDGVDLPPLKAGTGKGKKTDVEGLNALIKSMS
jgi:hypothetical protein